MRVRPYSSQEKEALVEEERYSGFKQFIPRAYDSMRKARRALAHITPAPLLSPSSSSLQTPRCP